MCEKNIEMVFPHWDNFYKLFLGNNNASPKDTVQYRGNRISNGQCNGSGCGLGNGGGTGDGESEGNGSEGSAAAGPDQLEGLWNFCETI